MSEPLLHPVGPHRARVYWRRRALVLLGAAVVLGFAMQQLFGGGGESAGSTRPAGVATAPAAAAAPAAAPGGPSAAPAAGVSAPSSDPLPPPAVSAPPCDDAALEVTATAGESSYDAGASPRLTLTVRNTGGAPCTRELGPSQRELRVTSGADRVWSSDDCDRGTATEMVTLAPGELRSFATTWSGRRSAQGCAEGSRTAVSAGTYRVHGRVGERTVPGAVFTLG